MWKFWKKKEPEMKTVLYIGTKFFILKPEVHAQIIDLLEGAEIYEEKWRSADEGGPLYYVYPHESKELVYNKNLTEPLYRMAKLAGKPPK